MAWRRTGDKPLSEPMMVSLLTHICVTRPQWVKDCTLKFIASSAMGQWVKMSFEAISYIAILAGAVSVWHIEQVMMSAIYSSIVFIILGFQDQRHCTEATSQRVNLFWWGGDLFYLWTDVLIRPCLHAYNLMDINNGCGATSQHHSCFRAKNSQEASCFGQAAFSLVHCTNVLIVLHAHAYPLQWRHNEGDGVSTHQPHDCLLNRLFRRRSKRTSKLRVTGLCAENSPVTGEFPTQMASNAENVSIW